MKKKNATNRHSAGSTCSHNPVRLLCKTPDCCQGNQAVKTRTSAVLRQSVLLLALMICACANAQSVCGKWERTAIKEVITDKTTGNRKDISAQTKQAVEMMKQVIELKSNNTWIMTTTIAHSPKGISFNGTYTLSGNQLATKLDPKLEAQFKQAAAQLQGKYGNNNMDNRKGLPAAVTIKSLNSSTMVWYFKGDTITGEGSNQKQYTIEEEVTYQKI